MNRAIEYIEQNKDRFKEELLELLRIPSVSADDQYKDEVLRCAQYVRDQLTQIGCDMARLIDTAGHPIVYGEKIVNKSLPTILIYGHYDVQPPDPLELWTSAPFDPVIRKTARHPEGAIFARGAADDKGQVFMHIKAVEAMLASGEICCNVKFIIEGEEEVGSDNLETFLEQHKNLLMADVILVSDTAIIANDVPSITVGLRGLSYVEVELTGPNKDLHSGVYGGGVTNPVNALCQMISSLHDKNGKITIPGFYDGVIAVSRKERKEMAKAPFSLDDFKKDLNVDEVSGEKSYSTMERTSIRPTLDVNGIWGGYIGQGAKTVLPSKAFAKISMRLVPGQNPDRITEIFTAHFKSIAPPGIRVEVRPHHGGMPAVTPTDTVEYKAAHMAMEESFGKTPIPVRGGGSIPIVALFEQILGLKTILMGFGLDSDDIHSPDEHYGLFNFHIGIKTITYFFKHYATLKARNAY